MFKGIRDQMKMFQNFSLVNLQSAAILTEKYVYFRSRFTEIPEMHVAETPMREGLFLAIENGSNCN